MLKGSFKLSVAGLADFSSLNFDIKDVKVSNCKLGGKTPAKSIKVTSSGKRIGDILEVDLGFQGHLNTDAELSCDFQTGQNNLAFQWLDAKENSSKQPLVYSVNWPYQGRAFMPFLDSPYVRTPYSIDITLPAGFLGKMG